MSIKNLENINLVAGVEKTGFLLPIFSFYYSRINMVFAFLLFISAHVYTHSMKQIILEASNIKPGM